MALAPPQQWGRCRDHRLSTCRDEAVGDRRFVQCIKSRGPLDLEARRLGARLAARPRRFQALEGGPAPGGAGAQRRDHLGVHGLFVLLCSQPATGLPPPVGLPPQRGRGSHECPAHKCSPLGGQTIRAGAIRAPPSALGAPCNDDGSRHRDPLEPVLRAVPAGAACRSIGWGWPQYLHAGLMLGSHAATTTKRQARRRLTHRELNGSSMFMSRSILFDTDAMQPRAAKDARGTTSTAQPPLPRCS